MIKSCVSCVTVCVSLLCYLLGGEITCAQEALQKSYRIKPSGIQVPVNLPSGQYQRIIRPFENWTMICDEDLSANKRVCNISQTIEDFSGNLLFNWALAATAEGKPYFILRSMPDTDTKKGISFKFDDDSKLVNVGIDGCNNLVCVGMTPIGPVFRKQIKNNLSPTVFYELKDGRKITVKAELNGLHKALSSID